MKRVAFAAFLMTAAVSCGGPPNPDENIVTVTPGMKTLPTNQSLKPGIAGINWASDTYDSTGTKMLKAKYVALSTTVNKRVQLFSGYTLGRPSIVKITYLRNSLVSKIEVYFVPDPLLWKQYSTIRKELAQVYGPFLPVGEPPFTPSNSQISVNYDNGKAPGTYWAFKKSQYVAALIFQKVDLGKGRRELVAALHFEPPDYTPQGSGSDLLRRSPAEPKVKLQQKPSP